MSKWFYGLVVAVICFIGSLVTWYYNAIWLPGFTDYPAAYGQMGDFFGGMLNPVLAFASFMALLYTIRIQSEQLDLVRRQSLDSHELTTSQYINDLISRSFIDDIVTVDQERLKAILDGTAIDSVDSEGVPESEKLNYYADNFLSDKTETSYHNLTNALVRLGVIKRNIADYLVDILILIDEARINEKAKKTLFRRFALNLKQEHCFLILIAFNKRTKTHASLFAHAHTENVVSLIKRSDVMKFSCVEPDKAHPEVYYLYISENCKMMKVQLSALGFELEELGKRTFSIT